MSQRCRVLSLYRKLLRTSRSWPGPEHEKQYILQETRSGFSANRHITDTREIDQLVLEGHTRYDLAWHYKIPYPRLHHAKQQKHLETPVIEPGAAPTSKDPEVARKLQAAFAKLKNKGMPP